MCLSSISAEPLRVVSYNVENLFHPKHDTIITNEGVNGLTNERIIEKDDYEWTQEGERHWSYSRYWRKVENIARVLTNIGEWQGVDIVGLQEVENALCMRRLCRTMGVNKYDFVHYESPDPRGIDVALMYKKERVDTIQTRAIRIKPNPDPSLKGRELITRDILYVCAQVDKQDTIHFFVCHLPSQRGGKAESEWKRKAAKEVLQKAIDSVYVVHSDAKIVVMGDMNSEPNDDLRGVRNKALPSLEGRRKGTHKYQGRWMCLDQFYISPAIDSISTMKIYDAEWIMETDEKYMGLKPKRTYNGWKYQNGYSDHLPIVLDIEL